MLSLSAYAAGVAAVSLSDGASRARVVCDYVLDDFGTSPLGEFPTGWTTRHVEHLDPAKALGVYRVEEHDGRRALRARYARFTITAMREVQSWPLTEYPYLQWFWKVVALPEGGDERALASNDSAAGVYVVWEAAWPMQVTWIKFLWSTTLPVGQHVARRLGYDHYVVMGSGRAGMGEWRQVRVDLREYFAKHVGGSLRPPRVLAVATDADDTDSAAEAYYADFRLCREAR